MNLGHGSGATRARITSEWRFVESRHPYLERQHPAIASEGDPRYRCHLRLDLHERPSIGSKGHCC